MIKWFRHWLRRRRWQRQIAAMTDEDWQMIVEYYREEGYE
jgi:hypothetical protein